LSRCPGCPWNLLIQWILQDPFYVLLSQWTFHGFPQLELFIVLFGSQRILHIFGVS
jgi:hypothetical protein